MLSKNSIESSLLCDDVDDYTFLPIKRPNLIKHYYDQRNVHWVPADIDMRTDRADFDKQSENIQTFVKGLIAFFAPADGLVEENLFSNFQRDTSFWKEARAFYAEQGAMEMIHSEMYSIMADVLIRDKDELNNIFNSIRTYSSVKLISEFMKKYMDCKYSLPIRILAFICVEGILFNSAFASIYWIKKRNILRGFCKANEFIARDEGIHVKFGCTLFTMVNSRNAPGNGYEEYWEKLKQSHVEEVIEEAVYVNSKFVEEILPAEMIGMSSDELITYTKYIADSIVQSIGYTKIYKCDNPFDWLTVIGLPNKTNFFEDKVSEYSQQIDGTFIFDEEVDF